MSYVILSGALWIVQGKRCAFIGNFNNSLLAKEWLKDILPEVKEF